jgi:hypothetical protein
MLHGWRKQNGAAAECIGINRVKKGAEETKKKDEKKYKDTKFRHIRLLF